MTAEQRVELILETQATHHVSGSMQCKGCVAFILHQIKRAEEAARAEMAAEIEEHMAEVGP